MRSTPIHTRFSLAEHRASIEAATGLTVDQIVVPPDHDELDQPHPPIFVSGLVNSEISARKVAEQQPGSPDRHPGHARGAARAAAGIDELGLQAWFYAESCTTALASTME